jgi:hypothetical protein
MQSGRRVRAQVETDTESVPETSEGKEQLEESAKSSDRSKAVSLDKEVSKVRGACERTELLHRFFLGV